MTLRSAIARSPARGRLVSIPACVGGWNKRDSLDSMPPQDAVVLTNWFPSSGKVSTRNGYSEWATGLVDPVETLAEFNMKTNRKLLAMAGGNIYDISSSGAVGAPLDTGYTNDRWQVAQFDDASGGARMGLVNGADDPVYYDGSTISTLSITGSGLTNSTIVGINVFKSRSYFWTNNSQDFWYSGVNALGGSVTKFPLSRVSSFGGNLVAMANWSRDAGDGEDDLAVFFMSSGDVIVYKGDNPGDADAWALVGVYRTGAPLGIRAVTKIGSDVVIMTKDGYLPLSKVINLGRVTEIGSISDKISDEVNLVAQQYSSNFGWQAILYPRGQYILFNVPVSETIFQQHVINTTTQAWCKFENMNGICWSLYNDRLYFGGADGTVYLADNGNTDNGNAINFRADTAWNYLGTRQLNKRVSGIRPFLDSTGSFTFFLGIGYNFINPGLFSSYSSTLTASSLWDVALWDVGLWAYDNIITSPLLGQNSYGLNFLLRMFGQTTSGPVNWYSYDYLFEPGGYTI